MKPRDLLRRLEAGNWENVRYADFEKLVEGFGFMLKRSEGSHRIYVRPGVPQILDVQARHGEAKRYQLKDFLGVVERYGLQLGDEG